MGQSQPRKDYDIWKDLSEDPIDGVEIENNPHTLDCDVAVIAPDDSCYSGGKFHLCVKFNGNFPNDPPELKMITPIYHMNINDKGMIQLDKISNWNKKYTMRDVLNDFVGLLKNPILSDPLVHELGRLFECNQEKYCTNAQLYTQMYAHGNDNSGIPFAMNLIDNDPTIIDHDHGAPNTVNSGHNMEDDDNKTDNGKSASEFTDKKNRFSIGSSRRKTVSFLQTADVIDDNDNDDSKILIRIMKNPSGKKNDEDVFATKSSLELYQEAGLPIVLPKNIGNPWNAAMIENPSNKNEILVIGGYEQPNIFICNKKENTCFKNKVNMSLLQQNGKHVNLNGIRKVEVVNSNSTTNHIIVTISDYQQLYYAIFDCKSYQWINFGRYTNYIDQYPVIKGKNMKRCYHALKHNWGGAMIAVENYLIITHGDQLDILDISDEMNPMHIHNSQMVKKYRNHGCTRLPNNYNTSIRLLLFGGDVTIFSNSVYELEITFRTKLVSGQQYPISHTQSNVKGWTVTDKYIDSNGKDIEIEITHKPVAWKCRDVISAPIFDEKWGKFSYQWKNESSDLILSLNKKDELQDIKQSENLCKDNSDLVGIGNGNCRYLAVYGGYYYDSYNGHINPQGIAVFDAQKLEWESILAAFRCTHIANSVTDEKEFLYVLGCNDICRVYTGLESMQQFMDMIGKTTMEASLFKQLFLSKNRHSYALSWQRWKYMCAKKMIDPAILFHRFLFMNKNTCQTVLESLWTIAKQNITSIPIMSKWMNPDDLMAKIHFIFENEWWESDDIHLLETFVGNWYNENEFDNNQAALMHQACKHNNTTLLAYLINNKIYDKMIHNSKNKMTGRTCLDVALINKNKECVRILVNAYGSGKISVPEATVDDETKTKMAIDAFKDVFVYNRKISFPWWKYICEEKFIEPVAIFHQYLKDNNSITTRMLILESLWSILKCDTGLIPTICKWIDLGDLVNNMHLKFEQGWRQLDDIHLLKALVGSYYTDEFDSDESTLLHCVCKYNNHKLLKYLIQHNICNEKNHNSKNKKTRQTCLDIALMNDNDECIDILIKSFGYESASIFLELKTPSVHANALASRELSVLKTYHNNGINWNVKDEKGLSVVDYILKYGNDETLEYVIRNGIFSIEELIELKYSKYNSNASTRTLLKSIWRMAKKCSTVAMPTMSNWIDFSDLMQNIHLIFESDSWELNDVDLLEKFVRNWHNADEFESNGSALLYDACKLNNVKILNYLIDNKIVDLNKMNYNTKNKLTGETCLDIALMNDNMECVDILMNAHASGHISQPELTVVIDKKMAISAFNDVFLYQHKRRLIWWKFICEQKLIDPVVVFHTLLRKDNLVSDRKKIVASMWLLLKDGNCDTITVTIISKWVGIDDLMQNIHLILDHGCWELEDVCWLKEFVRNFYGTDEFDSATIALLHYVCKYNNHKLLNYLIKHNIFDQNNHRSKNKKTGQTCLDVALINSNDECIDILIRKFGCKSVSILDIKTPNVQVNALASREVGALNTYHNNGINWDVADEKGLRIIDYISKHGNQKTLEYVIKNGICLLDYNLLRCAILHDSDQILAQLLTSLLKQAKIESIEFYGENRMITFEFIFNLFKFCYDKHASNDHDKCSKLLKHWLQTISKFHSTFLPSGHGHTQINYGTNNPANWRCILCLEEITVSNKASNHKNKYTNTEYDYCGCCDFLICHSCKNIDDYQSKRVQLIYFSLFQFNLILFCVGLSSMCFIFKGIYLSQVD